MSRQALIVLGMHRSGTSALTGALHLLGAALPSELMQPHEDNRRGYWESRPIARFNNRLLASFGLRWDSDAPLVSEQLCNEFALKDHYQEARSLLAEEFGDSPLFVFKDPRLCRLLPFWERVLTSEGIDIKVVLCLRDSTEVAASLASRFADPSLHPAAIRAHSRANLLWLRHVLDAERSTRHLPRMVVEYPQLLSDWRIALQGISSLGRGLTLPDPEDPRSREIDLFLDRKLRRQSGERETKRGADIFNSVSDAVQMSVFAESSRTYLDEFAADFERLLASYASLRSTFDRLCLRDIWAERIVQELHDLHPAPRWTDSPIGRPPRVLFVSRTAESRAHSYRVLHPLAELLRVGWQGEWLTATDSALAASIGRADVVVVSRGPWGRQFREIRAACSARSLPLLCDMDDLTFEPGVMEAGYFAYFEELDKESRENFLREAVEFQSALTSCDAILATTDTLAAAASEHMPRAFVLPNCFSREMIAAAETLRTSPKPSSVDGCIRVGFASGTPTHTRDFATIAESIADFLASNTNARFVLVGYLDLARFPCLLRHMDRIECRPAVSLAHLYTELARFDINVAPLEVGNPFCEAKSEIRFTAAAALGIPTIASATAPMRKAIIHRETGLLAAEANEWPELLQETLDDPALRARLGTAARIDTRARFGPEKTARLASHFLSAMAASAHPTRQTSGMR